MNKLPKDYPVSELSPYDILGVSENNSIAEINNVYKRLLLLLHPDKELTSEAKRLGWSKEDKNTAFQKIRIAYKQILSERKESDVPDYNIEYYIQDELKQDSLLKKYNEYQEYQGQQEYQGRQEYQGQQGPVSRSSSERDRKRREPMHRESKISFTSDEPIQKKSASNRNNVADLQFERELEFGHGNEKFNANKFNRFFEITKQKQDQDGFTDAFSKGYSEFFRGLSQDEINTIKSGQGRQDINVTTPTTFSVPEMKNGQLVEWIPKEHQALLEPSVGYSELGLSKIDDFSFCMKSTKSAKDDIYGSDLMSVYGTNNEFWEDSVKRDSRLYDRFSDTTKIDKKMNAHLGMRSSINLNEVDPRIEHQLYQQQQELRKMEELRKNNLRTEDKYYSEFSSRRLQF